MIPMLMFSKNRPFWVWNYLESLRGQPFDVMVLYSASDEYVDSYRELEQKYKQALFIDQDRDQPVKSLVDHVRTWAHINGDVGILSVDDNLCTRDVDEWVVRSCIKEHETFGFSLRLQNGIRGQVLENESGIIRYNPSLFDHRHSWGYCWEVSSTVYRMSTIIQVLNHCPMARTPNQIEVAGMRMFKDQVTRMACFERAPMLNVFVDSHRAVTFKDHLTEERAQALYLERRRLDLNTYAARRDELKRLHVSEVHLCPQEE